MVSSHHGVTRSDDASHPDTGPLIPNVQDQFLPPGLRSATMLAPMADLADAAGISTVHCNRVVQELRRRELIECEGRLIQIRDWEGWQRAGDLRHDYLQLRKI